jgi:DNA-binding IclR family transcriptional regulator
VTDETPAASVLLNGIRVMQAFSVGEPVLGVTEIARRVELHKSSVSRILRTLEQASLVERDADSGRYRLGLGVIALAGPLLANLDVRRVAAAPLAELAERTRETAALMVWTGAEAVSVEQVPGPQLIKHAAAIGTRYAGAASASVQVFLAALPAGRVRSLLDEGRIAGPADPAGLDAYLARLAEVRAEGVAVNDGESAVDEVGVAAPVRDHRGEVAAAVLLSAPRYRVSADVLALLVTAVRASAAEISSRLGWSRPGEPAAG